MRRLYRSMVKSRRMKMLFSMPYLAWTVIFIVVPLLMILWYGITDPSGAVTIQNILAMGNRTHRKALLLSVLLSLISVLICLLIAYPLCMILAEKKTQKKGVIVLLFILPMWMNTLLRTMAWQSLLEKTGIINSLLQMLHIAPLNIINTPYAIILGMVYNFLPFMVLPIYNVLSKIDKNVINAARDLGASSFQTFALVILPLSVSGIMSGITMVFIPALTTFVISQLLGGSKILLIGNVIEQEFTQAYDWNLGSGLSLVLMIFIIINMLMENFFDKNREDLSI